MTANAGCGIATSALELVIARVLQGFAGGLITPQITGVIQDLLAGEERGKAFGFFGTTIGVSTAIGPLLGGALIALFGAHNGWRAVFFVNVPVGALALVLARRYLPASAPGTGKRTALDPIGVLLLGAAVVCLLVPFIEQRTWHSPLRPGLFPLSGLLLVIWVLHERRYGRDREPVVSLDLFRIRSYVLGAGVGVLFFAGFTGTFSIFTLYLQIGLHDPAWKAGLSATPFAVGMALMACWCSPPLRSLSPTRSPEPRPINRPRDRSPATPATGDPDREWTLAGVETTISPADALQAVWLT